MNIYAISPPPVIKYKKMSEKCPPKLYLFAESFCSTQRFAKLAECADTGSIGIRGNLKFILLIRF